MILMGMGLLIFEKFKKILNNENLDLIYLHLNLPHLPANYAEKVFNVKTPKDMRSYFLNLKLLDLIMNKIYGTYINSNFFRIVFCYLLQITGLGIKILLNLKLFRCSFFKNLR